MMNKNKFDRLNLVVAMISSVGSIIALMIFYIRKRGININDKWAWENLEPALLIVVTMVSAIFFYLTSKKLKKRERTVFLIYSHNDIKAAQAVREELRYFGIRILMDEQVINIGDNISDMLKKNITHSDKIIILLSKNTENSNWVKSELEYAKSLNKQIFPAMIEKSDLPELLQGIKYADLTEINNASVEPIVNAIRN